MRPVRALLPLAGLAVLASLGGRAESRDAAPQPAMPGVANPAQAHVDYMLKCQGCHQPEGGGNMAHTPPIRDQVARFLAVPGGREFLARVPGVASTDLPDARVAQLLNWTLQTFDAAHVPADFEPYSTDEIARLRKAPLRLERADMRAGLIAAIEGAAAH